VRVGSAEQSNSALIFDQSAFLKLFRKLEGGVQPDVEVIRFLNLDAGFHNVPALFGTITYRDATGDSIAGMLQEFLPNSRDAWSHMLGAARANAASAATAPDIELLGRVTRELHDALSGDAAKRNTDFAPVRAAAVDVERWAQRTKEMIREATTLLDRQRAAGKLGKERALEAEALVRRRDHYLTWIEEVADLIGDDAGAKIRIHGDYHLGQVLRTKSDSYVIIDFEGEPTRALAERREKTSALRDVAGMLRSLAYAAATLVQPAQKGKTDARTVAERELIAGRWERDARAAFLRGYTGQMKDDAGLLPVDPKRFDALLSLFETERTFYELSYELNHRPGWEWIPMRGISRLLVR
jgi:trehalose synthase-fused probable maltokinase